MCLYTLMPQRTCNVLFSRQFPHYFARTQTQKPTKTCARAQPVQILIVISPDHARYETHIREYYTHTFSLTCTGPGDTISREHTQTHKHTHLRATESPVSACTHLPLALDWLPSLNALACLCLFASCLYTALYIIVKFSSNRLARQAQFNVRESKQRNNVQLVCSQI